MYGSLGEIQIGYFCAGWYGINWVDIGMDCAGSSRMLHLEKFKLALVALACMVEIGFWCPF